MFDKNRKCFKVLNEKECHNGFQYKTGLNVDTKPFNDNPDKSCCEGGLYFAPVESIFAFLEYGPWVREVIIPEDANVVKDPYGPEKYRADKLILGKRFKWGTKTGIKKLVKAGADIHAENDEALRYASLNGHVEVVKLLLEAGADVHAYNDESLRLASIKGHVEVVKLLLEHDSDIHVYVGYALKNASDNGYVEVVELLKQYM
jgi:hypothetical protein